MNTAESDLAAQEAKPSVKRQLSILDLMMGMAVVAVALVLQQNLLYGQGFQNCKDPFWSAIFFSQAVAANSLALLGMLLLGREILAVRKAKIDYVCQPGHLLLLILFLIFCCSVVLGLYSLIFGETMFPIYGTSTSVDLSFTLYTVRPVLSLAVIVGGGVIGSCIHKWNWIWLTSFALVSLLEIGRFASQCYLIYSFYSNQPFGQHSNFLNLGTQLILLLAAIFVLTALIYDIKKGRSRDIPHWIGVIGWFVMYVISVLLCRIAFWVLPPAELLDL